MVRVVYVDAQGARHEVDASAGVTLMEAAIVNEVPSIVGFCGGMCNCATCHCYIAEPWAGRLPPADENERDTLRHALDLRPSSRLGCQVRLEPSLDGLEVELPSRQRTL
jgi:ferredoxin, 2Fe-2S